MTFRRAALALVPLVLATACSGPAEPVVAAPAPTPPAATPDIYAVVYRCTDGTVFTTFPRGESAQADFTARAPQGQPPVSIADCEGTEAKTAEEAEQLRTAVPAATGTAGNAPAG